MKFLHSFIFSVLFLIVNGQKSSYNLLLIGTWELIAHENLSQKEVKKIKEYLQFNKNGTFVQFYRGVKIKKVTGNWTISKNNTILISNVNDGGDIDSEFNIYTLNKSTLILDGVFYYEEIARGTYRRIK